MLPAAACAASAHSRTAPPTWVAEDMRKPYVGARRDGSGRTALGALPRLGVVVTLCCGP
jgi:hypothetical protein